MKLKFLITAWLLTLTFPCFAAGRSTPQRLWTAPKGASIETMSERPGGHLKVQWISGGLLRQTRFDLEGRIVPSLEMPDDNPTGYGVTREDWNKRGQHAFLPHLPRYGLSFLRMKRGNEYRLLTSIPRFNSLSLQGLRFSPDGECLYVLGTSRLWIIGAQSGRLIRIVEPRGLRQWSLENAALSPDCRSILSMRDRVTLFSTTSGAVIRRFGREVRTVTGHCGDLQAKLFFTQNGQHACVAMQDSDDYETWAYPSRGGRLQWHGRTPYEITETSGGAFFLDIPRIGTRNEVTTVLRRWRDGKTGWRLKLKFNMFDYKFMPNLVFSRDGRSIYFTRDNSLWKIAMPPVERLDTKA